MKELLIITFGGYSLAKILFTVSVVVLMGLFFTLILMYLVQIFMPTKKRKQFEKHTNTLGVACLIAMGYILVAIILHFVFKMPL